MTSSVWTASVQNIWAWQTFRGTPTLCFWRLSSWLDLHGDKFVKTTIRLHQCIIIENNLVLYSALTCQLYCHIIPSCPRLCKLGYLTVRIPPIFLRKMVLFCWLVLEKGFSEKGCSFVDKSLKRLCWNFAEREWTPLSLRVHLQDFTHYQNETEGKIA